MARVLKRPQQLVGVEGGLQFALRWEEDSVRRSASAAQATLGSLYLDLASDAVWGDREEGFHWTWIDLLESLTNGWAALMLEELDPLGLDCPLAELWPKATERWSLVKDRDRVDREQRRLLEFEAAHNLTQGVGGAELPALWVLRDGAHARVHVGALHGTAGRDLRRPFAEVEATLGALGDEIAARLSKLSDLRARRAFTAWQSRNSVADLERAMLATSRPRDYILAVQAGRSHIATWGSSSAPFEATPQMVAARLLGPEVPPNVTSEVLAWISSRKPAIATPHFDLMRLSSEAEIYERNQGGDAASFAVGYELAQWLRLQAGIVDGNGRVEPEELLRKAGVVVADKNLGVDHIDAVACWPGKGPPAVLVNVAGRHAQDAYGRRATLAHELCHLLVDRRRNLPVAEVLGGRSPRMHEQRANAFAAEFLLPRAHAGEAFLAGGDPRVIVQRLQRRFGVSREIVAWQARRSAYHLPPAVTRFLRGMVSNASQFDRAGRHWA